MAWSVATGRNVWSSIFYIFTPVFAVKSGLGELAGGLIVSLSTGTLFLMPLWGWLVRRSGLRTVFIDGLAASGCLHVGVALSFNTPGLGAALLVAAAVAMVVLDACGNRLFFAAVRANERANMTAVYGTFRDVADLVTPGGMGLVLRLFELPAVFALGGAGDARIRRAGMPHPPATGPVAPAPTDRCRLTAGTPWPINRQR